jgi:hypothetical protein
MDASFNTVEVFSLDKTIKEAFDDFCNTRNGDSCSKSFS